jgi:serine phosphatase RsbU (regulator of sigma subunit)/anti-sigma regulatory factor (Ser/Thr protein kinase)
MAAQAWNWRRLLVRRGERVARTTPAPGVAPPRQAPASPPFDIAPDDPLVAYFHSVAGVVDLERLALDSPALRAMRAAGVRLAVPLVSQGELIGLLNLGPRLSEQDYSGDDRALLNNLATQAAPAVRVAQLVRQQQEEAQERERIEQELRVARLIQQTLLPKELPALPGWQMAAHYQPARAVGGDFYDFLALPRGRLGLVIGDVTDKGVPAALVMATTRAVLRAAAQRLDAPGAVLAQVNDALVPDIPPNMFVTCLYAILDPATGRLRYANAGHDLPYQRRGGEVSELRATGMPLGLLPGMRYEEREAILRPGDSVLFYSDGLVEAHSPRREMFSFPRLRALLADDAAGGTQALVDYLLTELGRFTGAGWEQEDDITLMALQRSPGGTAPAPASTEDAMDGVATPRTLDEFTVPSAPGNERLAMARVAEAVRDLGLAARRLEGLKTAVAEATMNAMEHGNGYRPDAPVLIRVVATPGELAIRVIDEGGATPIVAKEPPDLEAKLANLQTPRGWGLFLIKSMVDDLHVTSDDAHHTVELILRLDR